MGFAPFNLPFLGFLVASFFIQGLEAQSCCPKNWFLYEHRCYGYFETNRTWNDAETQCTKFGKRVHLASIFSEPAMNNISSALLTGNGETLRVWIGLFKVKGKKRMRWVDASMVDYMPWVPLHSDSTASRRCFEMYGKNYKYWNDQFCDVKQPYLCKITLY